MKKCPVCGVEHSDIITVCSICGSPLPGSGETSAPTQAPADLPEYSTEDIRATVASVVSASVDEAKTAKPEEPAEESIDNPFVINAMQGAGKPASDAARNVKSPSRGNSPKKAYYSKKVTPASQRSEAAPTVKEADDAIDTTAVAAVSAQKVYAAAQNAINARNAQAAKEKAQQPDPAPEEIAWSERKHTREKSRTSNRIIAAACAFLILLIIALLVLFGKMLWGGDSKNNPDVQPGTSDASDSNPGDSQEDPNTQILPEADSDGEDALPSDEDADTADNTDQDNAEQDNTDPDAAALIDESDSEEPASQDNQAEDQNPAQEDENQPVVVPAELPAITDVDDTVYATSGVNVRDYPGVQTSNVINVLSAGQSVKRTGTTSNGWSRVVLSDGTVGYVSNKYLSSSKDSAENKAPASNTATINNDVNVRKTPGGDVIATLPKGTQVTLTGTASGKWTEVTAGGTTGYVYSDFLSASGSGNNASEQPKVNVTETNDTVYVVSGVNVRDYPSSSTGKVISTLSQGQEVKRIGTVKGWSQVQIGNTIGYVYSDYLSTTKGGDNSGNSGNNGGGSSKSGGYVLSESGTRKYTKDELSQLSRSELRLARNEIFARHGRKFTSSDLKKYFEGKSWYSGTVDAATFDANLTDYLNSYELANLQLIQELENN